MHYSKPPILHRDLKVENLLVSDHGVYKLCDFGSATTLSSLDSILVEGKIEALAEDINSQTTLQYRAPELVDVSRRMLISEKIDVWVSLFGQIMSRNTCGCLKTNSAIDRHWEYYCINFAII